MDKIIVKNFNDFAKLVNRVRGGVLSDKKDPLMSHIFFKVSEGKLTAYTTNRMVYAMACIPIEYIDDCAREFNFNVEHKKLASFLMKADTSEIQITKVDDGLVKIKINFAEIPFNGLPSGDFEDFSHFFKEEGPVVKLSRGELSRALQRLSTIVSTDDSRPEFSQVCGSGSKLMAANERVAGFLDSKIKIQIPYVAVDALKGYIEYSDNDYYSLVETNSLFYLKLNENECFGFHRMAANFPDLENAFLNKTNQGGTRLHVDVGRLAQIVERMAIHSSDSQLVVEFSIEKPKPKKDVNWQQNTLKVQSFDSNGVPAVEVAPCIYESEQGISFRIDYVKLLEILKNLSKRTLVFTVFENVIRVDDDLGDGVSYSSLFTKLR